MKMMCRESKTAQPTFEPKVVEEFKEVTEEEIVDAHRRIFEIGNS